jgi:hypothetical protein
MFNFLMKDSDMSKMEPLVIEEKPKPVIVEFIVKDKYETKYKGTDDFWFVDEKNKVYSVTYNYSVDVYDNLYTWKTAQIGDAIRLTKSNYNRSFDKYEIISKNR